MDEDEASRIFQIKDRVEYEICIFCYLLHDGDYYLREEIRRGSCGILKILKSFYYFQF
jgi:hypothetical protein